MMLDKRVNFFLCFALVTCTSPLYKRAVERDVYELDPDVMAFDEIDQRASSFIEATESPSWLDSVRIHEGHSGQSIESSIGTTQHHFAQWEHKKHIFLQGLSDRFDSHIAACAAGSSKRDHFAEYACVCKAKGRFVVRVTDRVHRNVIRCHLLTNPVLVLFAKFYEAVPYHSSTGLRDTPDYDLVEINAAVEWLWNTLTKHEDSLPVLGFVNVERAEEVYIFGPIQQSMIKYLSEQSISGRDVGVPAANLASELAQRYRSLRGPA